MNSLEKVISFEHVDFTFDKKSILKDVSFCIKKGEFVCLLGPNGGGKTTLLKLLMGLLAPTNGTILINGLATSKMQKTIGYMPQYMHYDPRFPITVSEVILMGRIRPGLFGGIFGKNDYFHLDKVLRQLDLQEVKNHLFNNLSGGQKQRVLIARALVSGPEILIFDEPLANIDATAELSLMELLASFKHEKTILFVSHEFNFVDKMVDKVLCINKEVVVHQTKEITTENLLALYHGTLKIVQHEHL